ncbi:hypothetical protein A3F27_00680 [Candidatus Kaiserbacteria bacterium RIFCSPHIGHO2_12_FULL_53_13]|uniref:Hydroxyacid dehydrogenase n=1 Tax=Candidatus Kaiserbacteria bacterium RIFCSPHIGHO2_12_FULL_53_13 TaxID=1798502 RepID=A0A1F6ECC2_9BACT|nr:MAG: hypothetical protein A3F27_00680 [Candidatus Kaiserbacteria bacterium RIFCSPHIGHO2_12_FULL_53_13]
MKIVFFEISEEDQKILAGMLPGQDAAFFKEKLSMQNIELARGAEVISVFINSQVNKEIIDALPGIKLITTASAGTDHIDVAYARSKGIAAAAVPAYGSHTVAEFAFALILALSRKIFPAYHYLREDNDFNLSNLMGFDLYQKTLGIVGTGRIGKNTARIAKGFEMKTIAYDLHPDEKFATEYGVEYVNLPALLARSDIVTIHTPYTKETHHLINRENIAGIKKGALLINTARGEIVEAGALVWALNEGLIAGAGLDVFEGERYMKEEMASLVDSREEAFETKEGFRTLLENNSLIHDRRVIATPHMAFFSREAKTNILETTAGNIKNFIAGTPSNIVLP